MPDKNNVSSAPPELPPVGNVLNHSTTEVQPSKEPPASEKPQKRGPVTSEEVWNCAYNELAGDEATASLVEAYVKVLPKATNPNKDSNEPDNKEADKLHDDEQPHPKTEDDAERHQRRPGENRQVIQNYAGCRQCFQLRPQI